jgi:hypothetical protein
MAARRRTVVMGERKTASKRRLRTGETSRGPRQQRSVVSKRSSGEHNEATSSFSCPRRSTPSMQARSAVATRITWNHFHSCDRFLSLKALGRRYLGLRCSRELPTSAFRGTLTSNIVSDPAPCRSRAPVHAWALSGLATIRPEPTLSGKLTFLGQLRRRAKGSVCLVPRTQALRAIAMPGGRAENNIRLPL